jgi:hypothetical protein
MYPANTGGDRQNPAGERLGDRCRLVMVVSAAWRRASASARLPKPLAIHGSGERERGVHLRGDGEHVIDRP